MSNTVITNYTDLNGPSTKADSSVVVIVNKDGSLSVDQKLLGTLMGTDGSQGAGISVVRVGHEGKPDDATDSETEDDKVQHVTLSVDSYYDEPNSIIKYDSGAEMLQSLRIETRENSLVGFQNDHCYTPLTSPSQALPQRTDSFPPYDEPVIEISHTPPPKPVPSSKKITILDQQIIPKGKKIALAPTNSPVIPKGKDTLTKHLSSLSKKDLSKCDALLRDESTESSSTSSSGDSIPDRDSDSDYKDTKDRPGTLRVKKNKLKPRILKAAQPAKVAKPDMKVISKLKPNKNVLKREMKERIKSLIGDKKEADVDLETLLPTSKIAVNSTSTDVGNKSVLKPAPKAVKKEKKTPSHMTALLSDMTSLFTSPDVIRRVSTDNKVPIKTDKDSVPSDKKQTPKSAEMTNEKLHSILNSPESVEKGKVLVSPKAYLKPKEKTPAEKTTKGYDLIPQLDDASLAQLLQDTSGVPSSTAKPQPTISTINTMNSPGLAGPLSPTLDLLGGLQPEEEGLTEDLLMHVAQLVESSENLQEVIDKQVLGKVDSTPAKTPDQSPFQTTSTDTYTPQTLTKTVKTPAPRKDPIEIVRRDGRVIKLPPIEAPATRSSKRKTQNETPQVVDAPAPVEPTMPVVPVVTTPEPQLQMVSKQYVNKKLTNKKQDQLVQNLIVEKAAESQESWNSEDDPNRLWCICKQPHNNRFMICCDGCEDWFHGKCVNITKAMGQQMEEQGIEWRCPNCIKKTKTSPKSATKVPASSKKPVESEELVQGTLTPAVRESSNKTGCIVCKKAARASSIYCSDACILRHAQDSLGTKPDTPTPTSNDKQKSDSRVIVYERKSGRLLAGPNAPTAENLKAWLQKNPTFEVVRPGTLSTLKPNSTKKKISSEPNKIQTTLNFERIPRKVVETPVPAKTPPVKTPQAEVKERSIKVIQSPKEEPSKPSPQPKTPVTPKTPATPKTPGTLKALMTPKAQPPHIVDTPKASTSTAKVNEPRKIMPRASTSRSQDKVRPVSPGAPRRKEAKMRGDPVRENVRKALQEQVAQRIAEDNLPKFTEDEILAFATDTEAELHELFKDVGMKYKAKYRSLMFNIKDRKNLSLWEKICTREITPKQLVRLSPEELASQELAQWRDKEAKHQLELIKKSELDLLAATKTYVLKTHKGEEVMEPKKPVTTDLDPNVPVENLVKALNDSTGGEEASKGGSQEDANKSDSSEKRHNSGKKRDRDDISSSRKKSRRDSKRDSQSRKSRASRRRSELKDRDSKDEDRRRSTRKSDRRSRRVSSATKEKGGSRTRARSRSRAKSRSRSRSRSRTTQSTRRSHSRHTRASTDDVPPTRSRSHEYVYTKTKHDSTDSDSAERPKSAMLKDVHPAYDPHEPMITSAFSEEDLRKSREDMFDDNEVVDYGTDYDPSKSFSIDANVDAPSTNITTSATTTNQEKTSEAESDQEPSSTVDNSPATVWNGCINMVDVARFYVAAHEVSGSAVDLEDDLSTELDIVGRINPDTVWDYISKMKKNSNKDIVILRLQAANDEEKMQYIALYSYLSSRNRLGVVKVASSAAVKDLYIVPLGAGGALPGVLGPLGPLGPLDPLHGSGLPDRAAHLLLAIVIRQRNKRLPPHHIPKHIIPAKVVRESRKRSYTPPLGAAPEGSPPASPKRRALPLPAYTSPALSTSVKDKIAASLAAADEDEAYSPGSASSGGSVTSATPAPTTNILRTKMEELNRQIEEQKQQILKMAQADSSVGEDEAYSPSRPMTPPSGLVPLADIALPSNLQEILATIKQRSESTTTDVDMRTMPL